MNHADTTYTHRIDALRAEVRSIVAGRQRKLEDCLPFGISEIDDCLASGGLSAGSLHEVAGTEPHLGDDAAAALFVAGIAGRKSGKDGTILWALSRRDLFAPGLEQAGLPPGRLLYAECRNDEEVLAVMEEGLRHGGLAAVVGEIGRAAMTSTRRLQLAAEESGTMALILKRWRKAGEDPFAAPSAATTRWRIGCAPSADLPVEGLGRPYWRIELARQRGGEPYSWTMEGSDAEGRLALPAGPRHRSAAADRAGADRQAA